MDISSEILQGFSVATTGVNLLWAFIGVTLGTMVGVLPGLGPVAAMSILLPLTYSMGTPITAIIFMAGIYYGTQYGGSTTSILMNLPGEASSVVTTLDGYQMSRQGRAGAALAVAAMASFFAGTVATFLIAILAVPLSDVAFLFGPPEYTSLMILGLIAAALLGQGDFLKTLGMVLIGILLGIVGTDINSGQARFTLGMPDLMDGISFAVVAIGVFGLGEIIYNIFHEPTIRFKKPSWKELYPSKKEFQDSVAPTLRGTAVGSILGLLPGVGGLISSFVSYVVEKKINRHPEKFGKGYVAGVAAPEAANNAGAQVSFIPMLSIGLPTTPIMALMIATLTIHNLQPGPQIISQHPELFWGLVASMWIGNFMLLILNLPLVGIWTNLLRIPRWALYPIVITVSMVGTYHINNNWFDVMLLLPFALFGYILKRLDCEPAPMAMGFIVGTLFEEHLRRMLTISRGQWDIMLERPLSLTFIAISVIMIVIGLFFKSRQQ